MEFFNPQSNVNFMGIRRVTMAVSIALVLISIISLATRGLNLALDFTGGTLVEVVYDQPVEQSLVSADLDRGGFSGALVQRFSGTNFAIRLPPESTDKDDDAADTMIGEDGQLRSAIDDRNAALGSRVLATLNAEGRTATVKRSEFVGPQVGKELAYNGVIAILVVLAGIMIYIGLRFEKRFAFATIAGEIHDVLITLGVFSIMGWDFDLTVLAAVLAVDGYSVNDKIVVFDRVRELFRSSRKAEPVEIINRAINQTLSRTIMTSVTTLLTVLALLFFGGDTLRGFSLALTIGIVVGTLSTIFFASPLLLSLGVSKTDLLPRARDESELARRP